jgi:hypothetical protein
MRMTLALHYNHMFSRGVTVAFGKRPQLVTCVQLAPLRIKQIHEARRNLSHDVKRRNELTQPDTLTICYRSELHVAAAAPSVLGSLRRRSVTRRWRTPPCSPRKVPGPQGLPGLQCIACALEPTSCLYMLDSATP